MSSTDPATPNGAPADVQSGDAMLETTGTTEPATATAPAPAPATAPAPAPPMMTATKTTSETPTWLKVIRLILPVLIVGGVVGLMIYLGTKKRKQIEKMCSPIQNWAEKILCIQSLGGKTGGRSSFGTRVNFNVK